MVNPDFWGITIVIVFVLWLVSVLGLFVTDDSATGELKLIKVEGK